MKKKILFALSLVAFLMCIFAISVSASTIYRDENGTELLTCEMGSGYEINSYEIKNGGFAKTDDNGKALTWYLVSTTTEGDNTIKVVRSALTSEVYVNGSYTNGVEKNSVVSANFDEGMTSIVAFGSYSGASQEILFVYIPSTVTALPERFMQNATALVCEIPENSQIETMGYVCFYSAKNIRHLYFPASLKTISYKNGHEFASGASRLESVEFAKDCQVQVIPHGTFKSCSSLKSVTFPNSVTTVQSRVFNGCSQLEYINFGGSLKYMERTATDNHSFAFGAANLKTVVLPATFVAENLESTLDYSFQPTWSNTSQVTFYYAGTEAEFKLIQEKFAAAGNNGEICNASLENGRLVLINQCETFYDGVHGESETNCEFTGTEYFTEYHSYTGCARCKDTVDEKICDALFTSKGYSKNDNSIVFGIMVNNAELTKYNEYRKSQDANAIDIKYGVVVSKIQNDGNLIKADGTVQNDNVLCAEFSATSYSLLQIKITNISSDSYETELHCCAFVADGTSTTYLYEENGEAAAGTAANSISYKDIDSQTTT